MHQEQAGTVSAGLAKCSGMVKKAARGSG